MLHRLGIAKVAKAGGKLLQDLGLLLDLPQQQTSAVAADRSAIEISAHSSSIYGISRVDVYRSGSAALQRRVQPGL